MRGLTSPDKSISQVTLVQHSTPQQQKEHIISYKCIPARGTCMRMPGGSFANARLSGRLGSVKM